MHGLTVTEREDGMFVATCDDCEWSSVRMTRDELADADRATHETGGQ